jgi:hypothetical protein
MYAVTSIPLDNLTLATFRNAEFGFLGVVVNTFTHTPRLKGAKYCEGWFILVLKPKVKAGVLSFFFAFVLGCFKSW